MVLVAGGDSFVFGTELSDQVSGRFSKKTFPALLAGTNSLDYSCVARPGASNAEIARHVVNYCETHKDIDKVVLVQWTFLNRYEFYFDNIGWKSINAWDVEDGKTIAKQMKNFSEKTLADQVKNNAMLDDAGVTKFAKTLYKTVASTEYWEVYYSLKEVVNLQNYLNLNNIKFMFTIADSSLLWNRTIDDKEVNIQCIYQQLELDKFFVFNKQQKGFYQWALENKYPVGATHPLEEAHEAAALLIKDRFDEMVKEYI